MISFKPVIVHFLLTDADGIQHFCSNLLNEMNIGNKLASF